MDERNDLIDPIIPIGQGCCPICGGNLFLLETERNIYLLNKSGSVRKFVNDTEVECTATCFVCNKEYRMVRSHGIYRHYSPAAVLFDDLDHETEANKNIGKYTIEGNPLVK